MPFGSFSQGLFEPSTEFEAPVPAPTASGIGASGQPDFEQYVLNHADLAAAYLSVGNSPHIFNTGYDRNDNGHISRAEYGQFHYETSGRNEGRNLPIFGVSPLPAPTPTPPPPPPVTEAVPAFIAVQPTIDEFVSDTPLPPPVFFPSVVDTRTVVQEMETVENIVDNTPDFNQEIFIPSGQPQQQVAVNVQPPVLISLQDETSVSNQAGQELIAPQNFSTAQNVQSLSGLDRISNVDLGLIGAGGISVVLIGAIALIRRF